MIARATAPNAVGPGSVFPDAAKWDFSQGLKGKITGPANYTRLNGLFTGSPMALPLFWIALICQLVIVLGYFWFYRKEQLGLYLVLTRPTRYADFPSQHGHNGGLSCHLQSMYLGRVESLTIAYGLTPSLSRTCFIWNLLNLLQYLFAMSSHCRSFR